MNKIKIPLLTLVVIFINIIPILSYAVTSPPEITAPSAVLIDAATGDILYDKNSHTLMYPASTTKIMTAILTLENADLNDKIIIDKETPFTTGSRIYVIEGEVFTVEQLLYALLIESANDAAVALAKHISGNVEEFTKLMNKRAKELGAKDTNFVNPNGLPDKEHVSTAYDLAMIARHAMTLPKFVEIVKTVRYRIPPTNKQSEIRYLKTSNRFLWGVGENNKIFYKGKWIDIKYDKIEGIKTGYTEQAQQCLVTSASKDGHRIISAVLKAQGTNIYTDSRSLIDYGLENFKYIKIVDAGEKVKSIPIKNGTENYVTLITQNQFFKPFPKDKKLGPIEKIIRIKDNITAPIQKGQCLGKITFKMNNQYLGEMNLVAAQSIPVKKGITSVFAFKKSPIRTIFRGTIISLLIFLTWRTIVTFIRVNKRRQKLLKKDKLEREYIRKVTFEKIHQYYKKR